MTVVIRFYNGFVTLNEPISNLSITSNRKATEKQWLYRSTRVSVKLWCLLQGCQTWRQIGDLGSAFGAEKPSVATWRLIGDLFSRIWCFWRVFRTDLVTIKRSLKCSMYIAPCTRRQREGVENRFITIIDFLKIDYYRKSVWSFRYLPGSATFVVFFRSSEIFCRRWWRLLGDSDRLWSWRLLATSPTCSGDLRPQIPGNPGLLAPKFCDMRHTLQTWCYLMIIFSDRWITHFNLYHSRSV